MLTLKALFEGIGHFQFVFNDQNSHVAALYQ
jgi:hypothetical protein